MFLSGKELYVTSSAAGTYPKNIPFSGKLWSGEDTRRCYSNGKQTGSRRNGASCQRTGHHALGRVRTRIPAVSEDGPVSSVTQRQPLSRLRRYRLGNCTFVTFGSQGNQQAHRAGGSHSGTPLTELPLKVCFRPKGSGGDEARHF